MRNIKYLMFMLVGVVMISLTSCEDLSDLNVDPNNPSEVPAENLITFGQHAMMNRIWSREVNAEWSMLMVQHWAQNEYAEESRYTVDGNDFDLPWIEIYADALQEFQSAADLINANEGIEATQKSNQLAIIEVMSVMAFHSLTDMFGDIPYSQALKPSEFQAPTYDDQKAIYSDLLVRIQAAANNLNPSAPSFTSGDLIYNGDVASWKRFANSLALRIAMRMVDASESEAKAAISAISGDLITSNSQNATYVFDANPTVANPLYVDNVIATRDDFCVTDVLVDGMMASNDPRLSAYAAVNNSGDYVGMPYGLTDGEAFALKSISSRPGESTRAATAPAILMDAAEVHFLLAEAYERDILTGDAATAYEAGIAASMEYWGVDGTDYIANNPYDAGNWRASLGLQKWLAFYMNGPQAWAEWLRLDEPQLAVPAAATNPNIPVRLPYPISEQTRNGSAIPLTNPDDLNTKMWWDVF